jgi:hypothetical protein
MDDRRIGRAARTPRNGVRSVEVANRGTRPQGEEQARLLATQWELEYRETHTLSLDPGVLGILDAAEALRLEALPLKIEAGRPIFAVAEPSHERFAAVRTAVGENASFVVVSMEALQALLGSKVFNPAGPERPRPEPLESEPRSSLAPPPPPQQLPPPADPRVEEARAEQARAEEARAERMRVEHVRAEEARVERMRAEEARAERIRSEVAQTGSPAPVSHGEPARGEEGPAADPRGSEPGVPEPLPQRPVLVALGPESVVQTPNARLDSLLSQIGAGAATLAAQVKELNTALEESQHELRNAREQLERARLEINQSRTTIETLRGELAASQALHHATSARLRDVANAIEDHTAGEPARPPAEDYRPAAFEAASRIA